MALLKAKTYVDNGHNQVVDMDLEQFFDRVNHDILMSRIALNTTKSAASYVGKRKFLGYTMVKNQLRVAPQSIDTLKNKIRKLTARRNPQTIEERISKLNQLFVGWINYFRLAVVRTKLSDLDQWVRRRIRCLRLHQLKRTYSRVVFLKSLGVSSKVAWMTMSSGKGIWRLGNTPAANIGMNLKWFEDLGLVSLEKRYLRLKGV